MQDSPSASDSSGVTTTFFAPIDRIHGDRLSLPEDEAHHAARVLRAREGDEVVVVDGEGGWYRVRLDHVDRRSAGGWILDRRREVGEPSYHLTLAVGLLKQRARFELLLEKAAELGVSELVPIITAHTERETVRPNRLRGKLIAAMKQCGRSRLVRLREPVAFSDYLDEARADLKLCCHEAMRASKGLVDALRAAAEPSSTSVLIGPEGGFSEEEVEQARSKGWKVVSLGPRRLRTETAAIAAAAAITLTYDHPS